MSDTTLYLGISNDPSYPNVLAATGSAPKARIAATRKLNQKKGPESGYIDDFYLHAMNASFVRLQEGVDYKLLPSGNEHFVAVEISGNTRHLRRGYAI